MCATARASVPQRAVEDCDHHFSDSTFVCLGSELFCCHLWKQASKQKAVLPPMVQTWPGHWVQKSKPQALPSSSATEDRTFTKSRHLESKACQARTDLPRAMKLWTCLEARHFQCFCRACRYQLASMRCLLGQGGCGKGVNMLVYAQHLLEPKVAIADLPKLKQA